MQRVMYYSWFQTTIFVAALLTLPAIARAEPSVDEVKVPHVVLQIPKIEVFGTAEPEELKPLTKTPIQKMRDSLDKAGRTGNFLVRDYGYNDSTRRAQINTLSGPYCLEEKRGQIDFSGMNQARIGVAMSPVINDCR